MDPCIWHLSIKEVFKLNVGEREERDSILARVQVVCTYGGLQSIQYNFGILRVYHGSIPVAPQTNNLRKVKSRPGRAIYCRQIWGYQEAWPLA